MKLKLILRLAVCVSVILLCAVFGIYSFLWFSAEEHRQDFDLYTLVPQDAVAVLETDRLGELVTGIDSMRCSREGHYLYASDLFVYLKEGIYALLKEAPHGLSVQMDKMLLSFHAPDNPMNQVLYCAMGSGDYELVESFIRKYSQGVFPYKNSDYEGATIRIYPLTDGKFLAVYLTRDFLVVSLQKRLVEQVIDAMRKKKSLHHLESFRNLQGEHHNHAVATIYLRMKQVEMGKAQDSLTTKAPVGGWTAYDLKLEEEAIYCSGITRDTDNENTFVHMLKQQQPMSVDFGMLLPSTTLFYSGFSMTDKAQLWNFFTRQSAVTDSVSAARWLAFLEDYTEKRGMTAVFGSPQQPDSVKACAVLSLPLTRLEEVENYLASAGTRFRGGHQEGMRYFHLSDATLFTALTGISASDGVYATVLSGYLVLSSSPDSLTAYVRLLRSGSVLEGDPTYEQMLHTLSSTCRFLMMADVSRLLQQPEEYWHLLPSYIVQHARFFRSFVVAIQFTSAEEMVFPNMVLSYRSE